MGRKKSWMYTAIGSIVLSVASLFLPIISYTSAYTGLTSKYNILKMFNNDELIRNVFSEYTGNFLYGMEYGEVSFWIILLCVIGIGAIIVAFVGIKSMTKQYESAAPFRLAICGLVGTAIPSVVLLILYIFSKNQYSGAMNLGTYIIVTPLAMIIACMTVTSKYRLNREEAIAQAEAQKYIQPAGDFPTACTRQKPGWSQNGGQYYGQ